MKGGRGGEQAMEINERHETISSTGVTPGREHSCEWDKNIGFNGSPLLYFNSSVIIMRRFAIKDPPDYFAHARKRRLLC